MENCNMSTPTIHAIAEELNERARTHPIGTLQEFRKHRLETELFRVNTQTTQEYWACHWGGRTELQFNIGLEGSSKLRHGVAFDFEPSRSYAPAELIAILTPKVKLFNRFVQDHSEICTDMELWAWDCKNGEEVYRAPRANPYSSSR